MKVPYNEENLSNTKIRGFQPRLPVEYGFVIFCYLLLTHKGSSLVKFP